MNENTTPNEVLVSELLDAVSVINKAAENGVTTNTITDMINNGTFTSTFDMRHFASEATIASDIYKFASVYGTTGNSNLDSIIQLITSHFPEIENEDEIKLAVSMMLKTQDSINNISYSINAVYPNSISSNEEFFMYVQKLMNRIAAVQTKLGDADAVFQNFTELQAKAASMETQIATLTSELAKANEHNTKLTATIQMLTVAATQNGGQQK